MNKRASKLLTAMLAVAVVSCGVVIAQSGNVKAADTITSNRLAVVAELDGNVSISGEAKYDSTLTAEVTDCNSTSLIYCWTRDNQLIEGATASEYTLTADDIGCSIACEVSATDRAGMLIASLGSPVEKKDGPGQPKFEIVYPSAQNGDGKFVGVDPTMEYSTYQGLSMNVKQCPDGELTGLFAGDYYIRYAETATTKAGQIRHVWLISSDITGKVTLTGDVKYDSTLTAEVSNCNTTNYTYQWTRDGEPIDGATGASYKLTENDIGYIIGCEVSSSVRTGKIVGKTASEVDKKDGPDMADLDIVYPSYENGDGKIIGVDPSMEYSTYQGMSRDVKTCPDGELAGLFAGDYYIRYKETDTTKAGAIKHIRLVQLPDPVISGKVELDGERRFDSTLTAVVSECNSKDLSYKWTRDGETISGATESTYKLQAEDIGYVIGCEVYSEGYKDTLKAVTASKIGKKEGPAAPKLTWKDPSSKNGDGKISGLDSSMEWCTYQGFDRDVKDCTSSELTGLFAGDYYIRYKETDTTEAGSIKHIWLRAAVTPTVTVEPTVTTEPDVTTEPEVTTEPQTKSFEDFVERLYVVALGRESEPEGKAFWCDEVKSGRREGAECAAGFLLSDEFLNKKLSSEAFVEVLYKTFFDRDSEAEGKTYWVSNLDNGTLSREDVINGFMDSAEWCNICASYGVKSGALTAKATVASENAIKFASRLYTECLGREAEEEGLNFWALSLTNLENKGISAGMQFFNSDEFLNKKTTDEEYIKLLYRTFMGRDFDDDGLAYWKTQLSEGVDRNEVLAGFAGSPEFAEICVSCGIDPI